MLAGGSRLRRPEAGNRTGRRNRPSNDGGEGGENDEDDNGEAAGSSDGGTREFQPESGNGSSTGGRVWCLGRTLLVKAKVLINGRQNESGKQTNSQGGQREGRRRRTRVGLRILSLDGLIRQRGGIQKTLRGFVVEASLGDGGSKAASTSVAVSAVQDYLDKAGLGAADDGLQSFREAQALDERGNYQELNALLGRVGQRALFEMLLASCRVITSGDHGGKIGIQLLGANADGSGISATAAAAAHAPGLTSTPRDGPVRSAGSLLAKDGAIGGSATHAVGGGSRATDGRGGDRNSPIVVCIPPATSGDPATSPTLGSEDGSENRGEEEEEQEDEEEEDVEEEEEEEEID